MSSTRNLRKSVLSMAMGVCLSSMALSPALAQSATGAVAGRADAGAQVTVVNTGTGLSRTVTVNADGSYRLSQLPVGDYTLQVSRNGQTVGTPLAVNVGLGGPTNVNLGSEGNLVNIDAVQVLGPRVINRVDVRSTETATNVTREELARLPVDQSITSVAMLAPGVVSSPVFGSELSFSGSSVAENAIYINGLNVTDVYNRRGFSSTPFAFFEEFQVKTGGYSVEFGRSTGGVINAVTRSGTNEFEAGMQLTFEPAAWNESPRDHYHEDGTTHSRGSQDKSSFTKTNVWASGPIIKDRLFFFGMYEVRDSESRYTNASGNQWFSSESNNGFWGGKVDWNITDNHLLEVMAFSDEADSTTGSYGYNWDTKTVGDYGGDSFGESGGLNYSATYTGHFTDNFVAKAMYGVNDRSSMGYSAFDETCSDVWAGSSYGPYEAALPDLPYGCHPTGNRVNSIEDKREAARLDFEWTLGDHLLRFGFDREVMETDQSLREPGPVGISYQAIGVVTGQELDNGYIVEAGIDQMLVGRRYVKGGVFETEASAYYLEDVWSITPNLLLTLGVRMDSFTNKAANGDAFIDVDNLFAPRMGFSWDMNGDGSTKVYGNIGRYYLPVTNNINVNFAGGLTDEETFYVLEGWNVAENPITGSSYLDPIIGAQKGGADTSGNVDVDDLPQGVDRDIHAVFQDELILGYQTMSNQAWSWGVNGTYRRLTSALDDILIRHTPCGPTNRNVWVIGNPGEDMTIWGNPRIGCATEGWITIDTSVDGYQKSNGEVVGYDDPERTYTAVEFQIDRAWDGKWAFNASYLWSRSEGNFEGPVNSDTRYGDTGMVQYFDHPAGTERYGDLFNDRRHQIKLRGSYALNDMFSFGANLHVASGGPLTAFGVTWPGDTRGAGSFSTETSGAGSGWICVENCSGPVENRVHEWTERGGYGRLPWTWTMGANVTWTLPVPGIDLKAKFSVFNLFNNQSYTNVHSRYESSPGVYRDTFGQPIAWQSPRYMQLVVTYNY